MLFNSHLFLLGFLPVALVLYAVAGRSEPSRLLLLQLVVSFVFYGGWDVRFVPFLLGSIGLNWARRCCLSQPGGGDYHGGHRARSGSAERFQIRGLLCRHPGRAHGIGRGAARLRAAARRQLLYVPSHHVIGRPAPWPFGSAGT